MIISIDFLIVIIFFILTIIIGLIGKKKLTLDDYWVNSRKTNKFALIATVVSTAIGAGAILGNASIVYSGAGFAMLFFLLSYVFYFYIFAKFFAPKIKEFGDKQKAYTLPDYLGFRYNKKVRIASALTNLTMQGFYLALQMLAIGTFVFALTGFNQIIATIIGALIVIIYTSIGGLRADIRTDIFQFFVMFSLLLIFLPILIVKGGGFNAIFTLPSTFLIGKEFAPFYVYLFAFLFLGAQNLSSLDLWQRAYAGDTIKNVRKAMIISNLLVFSFLLMALLFGIYGKIILPNADPNFVVVDLLKLIIPVGLFGIVLAGFFAAVMSSADTILLITSMTIVHDIYQKTSDKKFNLNKLLKLSRWITFLIGIFALIVALLVFNIAHLIIQAVSFSVVLLPSIIFGFYWKKANSSAALLSIILGFITILIFLFINPIQAFIPGLIVSFITFLAVTYFKEIKR